MEQTNPIQKPKKDNTILIVGIVLAIVVIMIVGVLYMVASAGIGIFGTNDDALWDYSLEHKTYLTESNGHVVNPSAGKEFVIATIFLMNDSPYDISNYYQQWSYTINGLSYDPSGLTYIVDTITYDYVTVKPGGQSTFQVVFEVPSGLSDGHISFNGNTEATVIYDPSLL